MKKQHFQSDIHAFYYPSPAKPGDEVSLPEEEARHIRVLRLIPGSTILLLDGNGIRHHAHIKTVQKRLITAEIADSIVEHQEATPHVILGIGVLSDKTRMEWCVEKAVELGIEEFIPLITEHTEGFFPQERAQRVAIAALKQSQRAFLPKIHTPQSLDAVLESLESSDRVFLCHEQTAPDQSFNLVFQNENYRSTKRILLLIGPEGGFSDTEVQAVTEASGKIISLGTARLRAETAAITALAVLHNYLETLPGETRVS